MASAAPSGSSVDRLYGRLKSRAIAYAFRPGERINELGLAREFGVSRAPLREALNRLATEGFLRYSPRRGFIVRLLDAKEVLDLYEYRSALETASVRLACERGKPEEIAELEHFLADTAESVESGDNEDALRFLDYDEQFHERIVAMTRNAELLHALRNVNARIRFVRWIDMQNGRRKHTQREHRAVVRALKKRDAEAAAHALGDHITHRVDQIQDVIKEGFARIYMGQSMGER